MPTSTIPPLRKFGLNEDRETLNASVAVARQPTRLAQRLKTNAGMKQSGMLLRAGLVQIMHINE